MGGEDDMGNGSTTVLKLDTNTQKLSMLSELPKPMLAHQVIYLPATEAAPKGTIYAFGGLLSADYYQDKNFKYDVDKNEWKEVMPWKIGYYRLSFNLLPLIENRFILVISHRKPVLFDT